MHKQDSTLSGKFGRQFKVLPCHEVYTDLLSIFISEFNSILFKHVLHGIIIIISIVLLTASTKLLHSP